MDTQKLKLLLSELQKIKTFEKIKSTKDFDAIVDILKFLIDKFSVAKGEQGIKGDEGERGEQGLKGFDGKNGRNGIDGKNGKDANETIIIKEVLKEIPIPKDGLNGADGSPDTPEVIKQKLESLEEGERLKISAIEDLEKRLEELKKTRGEKVYIGGGSSGGLGGHVQYYDLSSQLNGNLRVFSVPAFARILNVQLSSFPNILRPVVDWTSDAAAMTLTLTSEIPDSSISSGQTLVVLYATL